MNLRNFEDMELPDGIRERYVAGVNGLTVHLLEAGFDTPKRPAVLLLHGFPELAYSWRKIMLPLLGHISAARRIGADAAPGLYKNAKLSHH